MKMRISPKRRATRFNGEQSTGSKCQKGQAVTSRQLKTPSGLERGGGQMEVGAPRASGPRCDTAGGSPDRLLVQSAPHRGVSEPLLSGPVCQAPERTFGTVKGFGRCSLHH